MFTSFTGNPRRARQVNLSGKKTNPFGPPGSGAGSQAALDRAQQDRAQRQRERDTLNAARRIQRLWRGHSARKRIADQARGEWDAVEGSDGRSQQTPYASEDEALAQLRRLLRFASTRSEDDLRRIQHYGARQMQTVSSLGITASGPWPSAYLRLQRILLVAIERQLKVASAQWNQVGQSLAVLRFLADQIPAETSRNAQHYYRALAQVVSRLSPVLESPDKDGLDVVKVILETIISPLKVTGYTLDAYEALGIHFLTLPLLSSDSTSPPIQKLRDSLADSINYKLLANALATLSKRSGLQNKPELRGLLSRLRLLGTFIFFHRYAHNFDTPEAYAVHKDFVSVVSVLLNSLPVNIVDNDHPIAEIVEDDGDNQDSGAVTKFLKQQVESLVHQEGIGSL